MPHMPVDPARLEGEALRRWYARTPDEAQRERDAKADAEYEAFFRVTRDGKRIAAPRTAAAPRSAADSDLRYGALRAPAPDGMEELRRQQAAFKLTTGEISRQNRWMAIPALAPVAAVVGAEIAGALAARYAAPVVARAPLVLRRAFDPRRGGDTPAAQAGRRAHRFYEDMARHKPGWDYEPKVLGPVGKLLKPDLGTPPRTPDPKVRRYVEVKPNTPSGRDAAARAVKKYEDATKQVVRALFYDLKRFK